MPEIEILECEHEEAGCLSPQACYNAQKCIGGQDPGWRDIDTAPRDGTIILLGGGEWSAKGQFKDGKWLLCDDDEEVGEPDDELAWLPLEE